jgi:cyclase
MKRKNVMMFTVVSALITGLSFSQTKLPEIDVRALSPNLYRFSCGVNNWIVVIGPDGVLLSDSAPEIYAEAMKSKLKKLGNDDVKFIINTHWHHDHTGGNLLFGKEAIIIAHQNVRDQLLKKQEISLFSEKFKAYPEYACPNLMFSSGIKIYFNGEEIEVIHMPNGHTAGDAVVYFRNANVLHIGDLYVSGHFPSVDYEHGGNVKQLAENLKTIIAMMPSDVTIISGHLQDGSLEDLKQYHNMLISTLEIVNEAIQKGRNLEEMKKAQILNEWEDWGKHVTCDMWIETIYRCLTNSTTQGGKR